MSTGHVLIEEVLRCRRQREDPKNYEEMIELLCFVLHKLGRVYPVVRA
jgi:hypothetical protein